MTFVPDARIEARAAELWRRFSLQPGFDIEKLLDDLELDLCWELVEDDDGTGAILGQLVPASRLVILNERHKDRLEEKGGGQLRFTIGHEIGHWVFHSEGLGEGARPLIADERTMCRTDSRESVEIQAEMFSAALLMQRDALKTALPKREWRGWPFVYELSASFVVTPTAMKNRLRRLDWIHLDASETPVSGPEPTLGQGSLLG